MTLYRRFALPVGTVAFALATAMHLHTVAGTAVGQGGDSWLGSALVSSLGFVLPILGLIAAFGMGWRFADAASTDDLEWAATIAIGALVGWVVGFVGVGYALSTLEYTTAAILGADSLLQTAVVVGAGEAVPLIFAALAGVAIGSRSRRQSSAGESRSLAHHYRSIALPTAIVAVLFAVLTWVRAELASAATGQFAPWYVSVAYPVAAVLFTLGALGAAAGVGWLAARHHEVGDDYGRWTLAAAVGAAVGWLAGSVVLTVITGGGLGQLLPLVGVVFSSNVLALIVAVLAGLSLRRLLEDSRAVAAQ